MRLRVRGLRKRGGRGGRVRTTVMLQGRRRCACGKSVWCEGVSDVCVYVTCVCGSCDVCLTWPYPKHLAGT